MKQKLLLCFAMSLFLWAQSMAQDRTVTGTVTDQTSGEPVPGVRVLVKNTTRGTVTDIDGTFSIAVPQGGILVFQSVGMEAQEVEVGTQTNLTVNMVSSTAALGEVVVTALGIESDKRPLGYSVQTVSGEDIIEGRNTNVVNSLNSKVAGVQVISSSGSPGSSANIRIRGNTSITQGNSPLFVIDGIPISNTEVGEGVAGVDQSNRAIDINPSDVASLTVLKGPAATALYGIRAAGGAIIITTKKGQFNRRPQVEYYSAFTADRVNKLPDMQTTFAQGRPVGGEFTWRGPETFEGFSWGPAIADLEYDGSEYAYDPRGRLVPRGQGNGTAALGFNNAENFFDTGTTWDNNLSVRGGTKALTYYLSFGHLRQRGIVPNADFNRTSVRLNLDTKITDKLSAGGAINYVQSGGNRIQRGSNLRGVMLGLLRTTPTFDNGLGRTGRDAADFSDSYVFGVDGLRPPGEQRSYRAGIYDNPYWVVNRSPSEDDVNRIIGNLNFSYKATKWLTFTYRVGIDQFTDSREGGVDIVVGQGETWTPGSAFTRSINSRFINSDVLALFSHQFGEDFQLNATIGHNYFQQAFSDQQATGDVLAFPTLFTLGNATSRDAFENHTLVAVHGAFADLRLSWRNMVFLNLTGRNDWASTLPKDDNSFFYPSVSLAFAFSELFEENSIFSFGKVRLSYGQVGNIAPAYATNSTFFPAGIDGDGFISGNTPPFGGLNAFERSLSAPNPAIEAELVNTYEAGLEMRFLNGRLGFDLTYYNSTSEGQIINADVSAASGFTSITLNAGEVENKGWELVLDGTPLQLSSGFTWDISVNFTKYSNTVLSLAPLVERIGLAGFVSTSSNAIAGEPYGVIYGARFQRNEAGQMIIGENGWPLQDSEDGPIGDPNPDFLLGINNTFSFKGVRVSALLDIRQGGDVWCGTCGIIDYFGTSQEAADSRSINGFVFPGVTEDGNPNTVPVDFVDPDNPSGVNGFYYTRYGFGGLSEQSIYDGSWVRMRELSVSYALPTTLFNNNFVNSLEIGFTGRNLFLITDYPGIDPETNLTGATNGFGLDYFNMPNTRSYGVFLKASF